MLYNTCFIYPKAKYTYILQFVVSMKNIKAIIHVLVSVWWFRVWGLIEYSKLYNHVQCKYFIYIVLSKMHVLNQHKSNLLIFLWRLSISNVKSAILSWLWLTAINLRMGGGGVKCRQDHMEINIQQSRCRSLIILN